MLSESRAAAAAPAQGFGWRRPLLRAAPWPVPALATWALAWALAWALGHLPSAAAAMPAAAWAFAGAAGAALALAWPGLSRWRRLLTAAGFPVSAAALAWSAGLPAWPWLVLGLLLLAAYPLRAWRDAPLFPTPPGALEGLAAVLPLEPGARVLDAGCGLGQGLRALRAQYPQAQLSGVEWSPLLAWAASRRCHDAQVRRGDLWADDWAPLDLVYLFQRPESMPRAWAKACAELRPGAWLASLDFAVPGVAPTQVIDSPHGPALHLYRMPPRRQRPHSIPGQPRRYPTQALAGGHHGPPLGAGAAAPLASNRP